MDGSPEQHLAAAARVSRQQALRLAAPEPEPEREPEPLTAFRSLFRDGRAESSAFQGSLGESGLRSVAWKAFLGVVPPSPDRWTESIESQRAAYADLKRKWLPDPDAVEDMDPTLNNPLCPVDDSPWAKIIQERAVRDVVTLDVNRIYPEEEFFASASIRTLLTDVLTIWALEHPCIEEAPEPTSSADGTPMAYRQGMHELLAPFVYVLENEKRPLPSLPKRHDRAQEDADNEAAVYRCTDLGILRTQLDADYTEHDAYLLFCKMMEAMDSVYAPVEPGHVVRQIYEPLLQNFDIRLYEHLTYLGIEPQLFALRWVRVCFGREFQLSEVLLLWDGIFAYSEGQDGRLATTQRWPAGQTVMDRATETGTGARLGLPLIPYICVAMLMFMRTSLIDHDEITCMRRLQVFPEMADNRLLLDIARRLRDGASAPTYSAATRASPGTSGPVDDTLAALGKPRQMQQPHSVNRSHEIAAAATNAPSSMSSATATPGATKETLASGRAPAKAPIAASVYNAHGSGKVPSAGPAAASAASMRRSAALANSTSKSKSEPLDSELNRRRVAMAAAGRKLDGVLTRLKSTTSPSGASARAELAVLQEVREQLRLEDDMQVAGNDTDDDIPVE